MSGKLGVGALRGMRGREASGGRRAVIAIDGPAGAGKSTIARRVAERMGLFYIDTGAMYRALAVAVLRAAVDPRDGAAVARIARATTVRLRVGAGGEARVRLNGDDVTESLREPAVDQVVPVVASSPSVRAVLIAEQRRLAAGGGVVLDGRDIGSVVLPDADHKFFVTADLRVRVERRLGQMRAKGFAVSFAEVERDLLARDALDADRTLRVGDAILIDTTRLSVEEAVRRIDAACGTTGADGHGHRSVATAGPRSGLGGPATDGAGRGRS